MHEGWDRTYSDRARAADHHRVCHRVCGDPRSLDQRRTQSRPVNSLLVQQLLEGLAGGPLGPRPGASSPRARPFSPFVPLR